MLKQIAAEGTYVTDHHPRCSCGNQAVAFIEVHWYKQCDQEPTLGNFKCALCLKKALRGADSICKHGGATCPSCGLVIATPSDLIVRVVRLR